MQQGEIEEIERNIFLNQMNMLRQEALARMMKALCPLEDNSAILKDNA